MTESPDVLAVVLPLVEGKRERFAHCSPRGRRSTPSRWGWHGIRSSSATTQPCSCSRLRPEAGSSGW